MRVRRYWIGYDSEDVNRAHQALLAQQAFLDRVHRLEKERVAFERERALQRIAALKQELARLNAEEQQRKN